MLLAIQISIALSRVIHPFVTATSVTKYGVLLLMIIWPSFFSSQSQNSSCTISLDILILLCYCILMPRTLTGRRVMIATLNEIMTNPLSTIDQKLEACKILAGLQPKPKQKTEVKEPEKNKPKTSKLLS